MSAWETSLEALDLDMRRKFDDDEDDLDEEELEELEDVDEDEELR